MSNCLQEVGRYKFSGDDWAELFRKNAEKHLVPIADQEIRYLEIGVHEGRSMVWMCDNVLRGNSGSTAVGVDVWADWSRFATANWNCQHHKHCVKLMRACMAEAWRSFPLDSFDVIYIDGDHDAVPVMRDTVLAWQLLRPGGLMIWDDRDWKDPVYQVRTAVEWFLPHVHHEPLEAEKQIWVRKLL